MTAARSLPIVFKNEHLSVSRLKKYETCPLAFKLHYIEKGPRESSGEAADFGVTLHRTMELVYGWVIEDEFRGIIPEAKLVECYRKAWDETRLATLALYNEGLAILRAYMRTHGEVDCWSIIDTEREFNFAIEGFVMNGYIDRVDRIGEDHIAIVDYKSNRLLFTEGELASDLQMSVYGLAARVLYPWAKKVSFVFHMLRFNLEQGTTRTAQELDDAAGYVVALGKRTESDPEYPAKLNANCQYCESRGRCPKWAEALKSKHESARIADLGQIDDLAKERERVTKLAKYCYARGKELDEVIKAKLAREGEFVAGGTRFRMQQPMNRVFALDKIVRIFGEYGVTRDEVEKSVVKVGVGDVEALMARVVEEKKLERKDAIYLQTKIDATAEMVPGSPKLDPRPVVGKKTAESVAANDTGRDKKTEP